jgi:RpiB/LacA/LacB family sugar-phosphate isomerase
MRVYLGSDHAGYELKHQIIEHLKSSGHQPIDCGAFTYDAEDDYPAFCIAAALKTVADPDSLGIVLGGSGNGEQIAANKVLGARGDGVTGPSAQQCTADRHRWPYAHGARSAGHRRRVLDHPVVES